MNIEMINIWQEIQGDVSTPAIFCQVAVIVVCLSGAWALNGVLRAYVMRHAPENWKIGIGGINRILFPLSSFIFVLLSKMILAHWQHTGLMTLASRLLLAMAVIRLFVYALRSIFSPSGWLKTLENLISFSIWIILACHLSGVLPDIIQTLEDIKFNVSKTPVNLLQILQAIFTVVVTLLIALWVSRLIENKLMRAQHINVNMRVVLTKLTRILLMFIAVLVALSAVGLNLTLLSVFGGALGVGLGFGLQKIASNYVSGFIILLDKSMQIGDVITAENHYGVVSDLRSRYLVLRKLDGTEVIIPNEILITNSVINHSFSDRKARVILSIQISYDSDLELAMRLMQDAAIDHPRIMVEPAPSAHLIGFSANGIDLNLNVWVPDPEEGSAELKSQIYMAIWRAFKQHNISIPFPQMDVRLLNTGNV
ncbi:MAG: mechanosensitive ion channel [Methylophilaceae bacterium]|nr:mechanosensitive ion channel [Methylophilaceae bacterium]